MKTVILTAIAVLVSQITAAQPHARVRHHHARRQAADVNVVTDVEYVTVDAADVIVYVDQQGRPVTTKTVYHSQAGPTIAPAPSSPSSSSVSKPAYDPHPHPNPNPNSYPFPHPTPAFPNPVVPTSPSEPTPSAAAPATPTTSSKPVPTPAPEPSQSQTAAAPSQPSKGPASGGPGFGAAISYSPYNADNSCKSSSQVLSDFNIISGYEVIRLYGTDCNQVANVLAATKDKGMTLFVGIFNINNVQSESQTIIDAVKGDWSHINTVSVGNELVNNGGASVGQVTGAIGQARSVLKAAGYNGPVVTVDTMVAMKANPELCHASDYCAINCHAFFDGNTPADKAGEFVLKWAQEVSQAAGGKTTVVTETGWPWQGQPNGQAVPSRENQAAAIASIKRTFSKNTILHSSFNCMWKKNSASTFGAEQYWGILGS